MEKQNIQTKRTEKKLVVNFYQSIDVQHINGIFEVLNNLDYDKPVVELIFSEDATIDLSFIQILISLKNTKLSSEQKITLKGPLTSMQKSVILSAVKDIKIAT